ncbi:terminase small subunit [Priestia flexa]|uniref:terminase small subunit n=1 Tax=Priestia flexa TaxID=86664 RepID=UPI003F869232
MADLNAKQEIFVREYLMSFNATQSAIRAGYSERTASVTGAKLLRNAKVAKKIDAEMKRLRERMSEDSNKVYAELWKQLDAIDKKIADHEQAVEQIDTLERDNNDILPEIQELNEQIATINQRKREASKKENATLVSKLEEDIEVLEQELKPLKKDKDARYREIERLYKYLIKPAAWEKIMSMRKSILHDILDRGGYKSTDKLEVSGDVKSTLDLSSLSIEELRSLAKDK